MMRVDPRSFLTTMPLHDMPPFLLPGGKPTPEQEVIPPKQSALSLRGLLAWLQKKDPEEDYCYDSGAFCLLAQYFTRAFGERMAVSSTHFRPYVALAFFGRSLPPHFNEVAAVHPWTFGAAADRCRDLLRQGYE